MWGSVSKFLAGSVVEFITNCPDFLAPDQAKVLAFWKVLPYQRIHVLDPRALVRAVRVGEEPVGPERLGHELVLGELLAVVAGDGVDAVPVGAQPRAEHSCHEPGAPRSVGRLRNPGVHTHPVYDGDQRPFARGADDGVNLKVTGAPELVDDGGTLAKGAPVAQYPANSGEFWPFLGLRRPRRVWA